jgi:hypothetical protein
MRKKPKSLLILLPLLAFLAINPSRAQQYMRISQSDGTVIEIAIADIQKLTFDNLLSATLQHPVVQQLLKMKLYPNPAKDYVNIDYTITEPGVVKLEIYSLDGNLVFCSTLGNRHKGNFSWRWQTNSVPSGTYICKIMQNQETITEKVVVNH